MPIRLCTILRFAAAIMLSGGLAAQAPGGKEPIAYIGHGSMFDQTGKEIVPTIAFIREAQAWYRADLSSKLTKSQRARFDKYERSLAQGLVLDEQSKLVANTYVIDWLLDTVSIPNGDRIRGKNNMIRLLTKVKLPERQDC